MDVPFLVPNDRLARKPARHPLSLALAAGLLAAACGRTAGSDSCPHDDPLPPPLDGQAVHLLPNVSWSGDRSVVGYISLRPDGPVESGRFRLDRVRVRDFDAATERALPLPVEIYCVIGGCFLSPSVSLSHDGQRALTSSLDGTTWWDVPSLSATAVPLLQWERIARTLADMSGAVLIRQTYAGQGGEVRYLGLPSGPRVTLSPTVNDPTLQEVAIGEVGAARYAAVNFRDWSGGVGSVEVFSLPDGARLHVYPARATRCDTAGPNLFYLDGGSAMWVALAGGMPQLVAVGSSYELSPQGSRIAIGGTVYQVGTAGSPSALPGSPTAVRFLDEDTLFYLDGGSLRRWDAGAAVALVATEIKQFWTSADGVVVQHQTPNIQTSVSYSDGNLTQALAVPPLSRATLHRMGERIELGRGSYWFVGAALVGRYQLYYDVLDGFAPADDNGLYWLAP